MPIPADPTDLKDEVKLGKDCLTATSSVCRRGFFLDKKYLVFGEETEVYADPPDRPEEVS